MGKPEFSSFEQFVPPKSLAERLKAQANGQAEVEAASFMAERFAPDLQTQATNDEEPEAPPLEQLEEYDHAVDAVVERSPRSSALVMMAFALVALVPVIAFVALYSRGAISVANLSAVLDSNSEKQAPALAQGDRQEAAAEPTPEVQEAAAGAPAPETILPKRDVELPPVTIAVPGAIRTLAGKETSFVIAIDNSDRLPGRSIITIRGLPERTSFSAGRPFGETEWSLRPDEIGNLRMTLPPGASGQRSLSIDVLAADGSMIASAGTRLEIAPDPKAALISRPDDTARIDELMAHGRKMVEVGYFPGARAYFQRAAEAGSADAALSVGASYDPSFIAEIGAQGIKPDIAQARIWYERAKALGSKDADEKLKELAKTEAALGATPAASAPKSDATPTPATDAPKPADATVVPAASTPKPAVASDPSRTGAIAPEWVEISSPVNMRSGPTPQAEAIRIAEPGKRYQATARQGSWVQVTDPTTSETGWVYARYVATADAPNR
jgi:Bacterial SH3 domain